ncbi:MAG TPA: hypothetical protein VHM92_07370 [Allosphingosinicella sp.]|nr:hypothetical protein [Allosphingosinicella sp.]
MPVAPPPEFATPDQIEEWGRALTSWLRQVLGYDNDADSDGDGVADGLDQFPGFNDSETVRLSANSFYTFDGIDIATNRPIWNLYLNDIKVGSYYLASFSVTDGSPEGGVELGRASGGFSYGANDGVTYTFEPFPF